MAEFLSMLDTMSDQAPAVAEAFMAPVVAGGHIWACIEHVSYYVWVKNPTVPDNEIEINAENIEQMEWTAYGVRTSTLYHYLLPNKQCVEGAPQK
jgi:hypothetical protein